MKPTVLIVKTGYSEFLAEEEEGATVSLGDVYRSTCLLWEYLDHDVSWLTSPKAVSLLPGDPLIKNVYLDDCEGWKKVSTKKFDLIINLERGERIKGLVNNIISKRFTKVINIPNRIPASPHHINGINGNSNGHKELNTHAYQEYLFKLLNKNWNEQPYAIPASANITTPIQFSVGFNHEVGPKWPTKAWPAGNWQSLAKKCDKDNISYSFQEGFNDLEEYFSWILKHQVILTNDSLGLHLAIGFKRNVIGMFGATSPDQIYLYGLGESIFVNSSCPIAPCYQSKCGHTSFCMETITPEYIFEKITHYINNQENLFSSPRIAS